jgi:fibronectin type 3 domain-containing protein
VLLLGLAVLAGGCQRKVDKAFEPVEVSRVPVPSELVAKIADRQVDLSWNVDAADLPLVKRYLVYRADSGGTVYRLLDSSATRGFTDLALLNEVRYSYRVSVRDSAGVEGSQSSSVTATPTLISVRINADSAYTSRLGVNLESTAAGASLMRLANDTLVPGNWIPFRATQSWTLSPGAGVKRVYAQYRLGGGIESSGWVHDDIQYDDRAQITLVSITDSVLAPGDSLRIYVRTGETDGAATYSLGARSNQRLYDDGLAPDAGAGDGTYSGLYVASAQDLFENAPLTAAFTDRAGNQAAGVAAPWSVSVREVPDAPLWLGIEPVNGDYSQLDLFWTLGQAKPFGQLLLRRDTLPGRGLNAPVIRSFSSASVTTARDTGLAPSRAYYYTLEVVLTNGLTALSAERSGATTADLAPEAVTVAVTPTADSSLSLTWTRSNATDFADYRVYRADSSSRLQGQPSNDYLVGIITEKNTTSYSESDLTRFYYYRVFVFDRRGQGTGSNTVWGPKVFGP